MVINIPKNFSDTELSEGYLIRRAAIDSNVPLFTDTRLALEFINAFCNTSERDFKIKAWEDYIIE
jgi:carbamoyl-phosphate synthase large subunit